MINIRVGQNLPQFAGKTFDGKEIDLLKLAESKNLVVYFYPKDDTPGCTMEGMEFSNLYNDFKKQNTEVVGMSRDTLDSHQRFCRKYHLRIPLLSDTDGRYGARLGLLKETGTFKRATLLVARDGKIKHIWENVRAEGHADEVLGKVKEMEHQARKKLSLGRDIGPKRREYQKPGQRAMDRARFGR